MKQIENLDYDIENTFTEAGREALMDAAKRSFARWLAEPDEYGYTPRKLLKPEQRKFLEGIASGRFSGSDQ